MSAKTSPGYRPDIDGLRAIAVLAVVGFHAFPHQIYGGFVGVDIFFVISGYLISGIILKGLESGKFSFAEFYARRIKRIFPALATVLLPCLIVGWALLLTDEFRQLAKHTAAGAAFVVNFVLSRESGYFDTGAELKPLLHLWSLSIEEQFYLLWPLLLYVGHKLLRHPLALIVIAGASSLLLNVGWIGGIVGIEPTQAFYNPIARFWELLLGATLAYATLHSRRVIAGKMGDRLRLLASMAGMLLIGLSIAVIDQNRPFPRWAVVPTVGAALIIAAGPGAWINRRVLSSRLLVAVGLISYPLYLWHWPLQAFPRIFVGGTPSVGVRLVLIAASFVLATLTYKLIEQPIRGPKAHGTKRIVAVLSTLIAAIGIVGFLGRTGVIRARLSALNMISEAKGDWAFASYRPDELNSRFNIYVRTLRGRSDDTILFIGDSNVQQLYPRALKLFEETGQANTVEFVTLGGCSPIPEIERTNGQCKSTMKDAFAYADQPKIKQIVIGGLWDYFDVDIWSYKDASPIPRSRGDEIFSTFSKRLAILVAAGKRVYLVLPIPKGPQMDPQEMVDLRARLSGVPKHVPPLLTADFLKRYEYVIGLLRTTGMSAGATILDPTPDVCSQGICAATTADGRPISKDDAHLRPFFVEQHLHFLDPVFPTTRGNTQLRNRGL
jgi:peptidoglycan/LPS O-acetylase OafA/YrhL